MSGKALYAGAHRPGLAGVFALMPITGALPASSMGVRPNVPSHIVAACRG